MGYHVKLVDRVTRENQIKRSLEASTRAEDFYEFRNEKISLKEIRVSIDLPIYRMENFRTFSEQTQYIVREKKPADFFKSGQENESVQQIQHEILARLADKGKADSVVPVSEVLKKEGQRESILITQSGIVVNGNRRLAAMREHYAPNPDENQAFGYVNCLVLPADATPGEILEIEAALQARPETRLDYDWIGDAQLLSAMLKVKGDVGAVAKRLNRRESEIKNNLEALKEADMYLKDWCNAPGEYSRVAEHGEQLFKDIPLLLKGKSEPLQEASRAIAWTLFEKRNALGGRVYSYNAVIRNRAEDVLNRLAEEIEVPIAGEKSSAKGGEAEYDFELDGDDEQPTYQPLIDVLKDKSDKTRNDGATSALVDICISVAEAEKDKKSGNAPLKAVGVAHAKLVEVDLSRAAPETYESIDKQLTAILHKAGELSGKIKEIIKAKAN